LGAGSEPDRGGVGNKGRAGQGPAFSCDGAIYRRRVRGAVGLPDYIPGLDGVRALSVMLVIVGHGGFEHIVPGGLGVTIFFFISGFLITNLLISEAVRHGGNAIGKFYVRRYLRLTPELYAYVLVCLIASAVFFHVEIGRFLASFLYVMNYFSLFSGEQGDPQNPFVLGHLWSLAVEEHFYLGFPLLFAVLFRRLRAFVAVLVAICVAAVAVRAVAVFVFHDPAYAHFASDARIDSIIFGCLLALAMRHPASLRLLSRFGSSGALIAALGLMLLTLLYRDEAFRDVLRFSLQGVALFIGVACLYTSALGTFAVRVLEIGVLRFLGRISYGMYLWHFLPARAVFLWFGVDPNHATAAPVTVKIVAIIASTAGAVLMGYLGQRLLLRPLAGLRHRFGSHTAGALSSETDRAATSGR